MFKFKHCTIDLETMDNRPTAAITAAAVVLFNLDNEETKEFEVNIDLQSSIDKGLTVSGETIMWWMQQSKAAQDALMNPKPVDIHTGLSWLSMFINQYKANSFTCWTHATFDAPILNYAFNLCRVKNPVHYRQHRDIRTLTWLKRQDGIKRDRPPELTAHRALDDARYQASYIRNLLNMFDTNFSEVTSEEN